MGWSFNASEQFGWRESSSFFGQVIPNVCCMLEGERPQGGITLVRPVEELMHHHRAGPVRYSLYCTFGKTILMVCSDSTVRNSLIVHLKIFLEFLGSEGVVVGTKVLESDTIEGGKTLEAMFTFNSFSGAK